MYPPAAAPTLVQCGPGPEGGRLFNQTLGSESVGLKEGRRGPDPQMLTGQEGMHEDYIPTAAGAGWGGPGLLNLVSAALLSKLLQALRNNMPFDISKLTFMEYGIFCSKHISYIVTGNPPMRHIISLPPFHR